MKHVQGGGGKFKIVVFTVKIRCHKDLDAADELDEASIDLADDNINFEVKGIKCAHDESDLMALMTYNAMGEEFTKYMLNKSLNEAYQEYIHLLRMNKAKEERMKKRVLTVKMSLEYPPHGKFEKYKKGQPCPKYSAKDKRAPLIQCDKNQEEVIKGLLPLWKSHM